MSKVKCVECGWLAVIHAETNERIEASRDIRSLGLHNYSMGGIRPRSNVPQPICHRGMRALHEEQVKEAKDFLAVVNVEIECGSFRKYEPGRSPREIEEMSMVQDIERRTVAWHDEVIQWQRQQEALAEVRHQENRRDLAAQTAKTTRAMWWSIGAAILAAIISGVLAILPWLINRGP